MWSVLYMACGVSVGVRAEVRLRRASQWSVSSVLDDVLDDDVLDVLEHRV